jgi:REP element-mobilizing transposase RayT
MARPLRIEYPGAWYHVMNRGRRSEDIFLEEMDYETFVDLLKESSEMWNVRIAAYCLMTNHYHILVQTPDANIARCMRHINGVYTQRFNRAHSCDGQLFRGRYKSILVNGDSYLLQLVRYIHRNPVRAGLAGQPDDYQWSSHNGYLSIAKKWDWLHKEFIFSLLTLDRRQWIKHYRKFLSVESEEEIYGVLDRKKWPAFLGPESFMDWVKGKYYGAKTDQDVPQAKELAPTPDIIIAVVCEYYQVSEDDLYRSQRGTFNEPRNVAIFLMRKLRRDRLKTIGRRFEIENYSSVSSIMERMKKWLRQDRSLKSRLDRIADKIYKGQKQT